jgi:hypothetical protein
VEETNVEKTTYTDIPRSEKVEKDDERIELVKKWHRELQRCEGFTDSGYTSFVRYVTECFLDRDRLWRKNNHRAHKLVILRERSLGILRVVHDNIEHKQFYMMHEALTLHFWWLHVKADIL